MCRVVLVVAVARIDIRQNDEILSEWRNATDPIVSLEATRASKSKQAAESSLVSHSRSSSASYVHGSKLDVTRRQAGGALRSLLDLPDLDAIGPADQERALVLPAQIAAVHVGSRAALRSIDVRDELLGLGVVDLDALLVGPCN